MLLGLSLLRLLAPQEERRQKEVAEQQVARIESEKVINDGEYLERRSEPVIDYQSPIPDDRIRTIVPLSPEG